MPAYHFTETIWYACFTWSNRVFGILYHLYREFLTLYHMRVCAMGSCMNSFPTDSSRGIDGELGSWYVKCVRTYIYFKIMWYKWYKGFK